MYSLIQEGNYEFSVFPPAVECFLSELKKSIISLQEHENIYTDAVETYYTEKEQQEKLLTIYQYKATNELTPHKLKITFLPELLEKYPEIQSVLTEQLI